MPCRHKSCTLTFDLLASKTYDVERLEQPAAHLVSSDVSLRVEAHCRDCHFGNFYYGSSSTATKGATAWPVWLLEHLRTLGQLDDSLRRACIVCRVPGIQES